MRLIQAFLSLRWQRLRDDGDEGIALIMVLGTMFVLTIFAVGALTYATQTLPVARHSEDYQIAGAAAQAGVDDYLGRLASCDTYWKAACSGSAADTTNNGAGWVSLPDTSSGAASTGQYTYKLLVTPSSATTLTDGVLRLQVKGRSPKAACVAGTGHCVYRVFTVDLGKPGLLNYIYFTDLETIDPSLYTNLTDALGNNYASHYGSSGYTYASLSASYEQSSIRANCGAQTDGSNEQYYYSGRKTASWTWYYGKTSNNTTTVGSDSIPCSATAISFAAGDTINGPLWTNDAMQINGALFTSKYTNTAWNSTSSIQPATANAWYWGTGPASTGSGLSNGSPMSQNQPLTLPSTNSAIQSTAASGGCVYTGPTKITLLASGKITVVSPYTTSVNSGCGTAPITSAQTVTGPANGVIYVAATTASCSQSTVQSSLGYPNSSDVQYASTTCNDGTAYLSGPGFNGAFTVAAAQDVYLTGSITYASRTGSAILGVIANNFIYVYHPVDSNGNDLSGSLTNPEFDGAFLSVDDSFTVENYSQGSQDGTLTLFGGIYQRYRGPVGTSSSNGGCSSSNSTGYCKAYSYDGRLPVTPPPYFLNPVNAQWAVVNQAEQASTNS